MVESSFASLGLNHHIVCKLGYLGCYYLPMDTNRSEPCKKARKGHRRSNRKKKKVGGFVWDGEDGMGSHDDLPSIASQNGSQESAALTAKLPK